MDVVEIGSEQLESGSVYKVKVLGAYAMIDEGELDWKIIAIRTDDPMAAYLNDIDDVERWLFLPEFECVFGSAKTLAATIFQVLYCLANTAYVVCKTCR